MKNLKRQKNGGFTRTLKFSVTPKGGGFTRTLKFSVTPKGGGFTLVETLIAISIFSVSILAIMSVLASGISNTNYAKKKMVAAYLAQEGIEFVRNMRDTEVLYGQGNNIARWQRFRTTPTINYPADGFPGFDRTVRLDTAGLSTDEVKIFSKVEWDTGSGRQSITFSEKLFNWIP